jgi:dsDNA-binding SOS-regulon protein
LTNTPPEKKSKLKINYVIELPVFIHNVYIESARNIFQNPFLFYHDYTSFELKKNQRDAINLIKNSINEAIRKMLPLNLILKEFLGNSFTDQNVEEEEIDKYISEQQKTKLMQMLKNENEDALAYSISSVSKQKSSNKKNPDILNNYTLSSIKKNKSNKSNSRNIPGMQDNDETSALYEPPNPNDIKESYSNKNQIEPIFESGNMLSHISEHNVTFNNVAKENKEIKQEEKINKIKSIIDSEIEKSITYNGTFGTNIKLQKI